MEPLIFMIIKWLYVSEVARGKSFLFNKDYSDQPLDWRRRPIFEVTEEILQHFIFADPGPSKPGVQNCGSTPVQRVLDQQISNEKIWDPTKGPLIKDKKHINQFCGWEIHPYICSLVCLYNYLLTYTGRKIHFWLNRTSFCLFIDCEFVRLTKFSVRPN